MDKKPLIKVSEGGDDFKMIDCEIISGDRPALETEAKNTRLIRTGVSQIERTPAIETKSKSWKRFSMDNPIIYIIVFLLLAGFVYLANRQGWPLRFGSN